MSANRITDLKGEKIASELSPISQMRGDDEEDTTLLHGMAHDAERYLSGFAWCSEVTGRYFGRGVGGIFAVFFFRIRSNYRGVDPWIWVMVGDIPSAYLPVSDCASSTEAFRMYVAGMSRWVELAREGKEGSDEEGVPPVNVPTTPEWAERLDQKLQGLRLAVAPFFEEESEKWVN